jgi:acetylornithine deacetylase
MAMNLDDDLTGRIRDAVAARRDEAVAFLQQLVREPSLLGAEQGAQDQMAEAFERMDLEVERFDIDLEAIRHMPGFSPPVTASYDGRQNVVGIHRPSGHARGRSLILNGHIDVVPTGPAELWACPPFEPAVVDGRVHGRGSGDMKAGIVAYCTAFQALAALGLQPAADVIMQSVIEEECTGNGALACLARGHRADAAIIPEPFNHTIMVAQLGVMWLTVRLTGKPAHVLDTSAGSNAIEAAYAVFDELRGLEAEWNRPENRHEAYGEHVHPVNFNLGRISGGDWASTVPCAAAIDVRVGFYPGMSLEEVRRAVEARIDHAVATRKELKGAKVAVDYRGFQAEGAVMDADSALMTMLAQAHRRVTNRPVEHMASTATTDARFFQLYGNIPATCYGPEATNIHGIDESVSIDSMMEVAQVLAVFMAEWCGVEARDGGR